MAKIVPVGAAIVHVRDVVTRRIDKRLLVYTPLQPNSFSNQLGPFDE